MNDLEQSVKLTLTEARDYAVWIEVFERMPLTYLRALYRIAKNPARGAYPFFKNPKMMRLLRQIVNRRNAGNTKSLLITSKLVVDNSL